MEEDSESNSSIDLWGGGLCLVVIPFWPAFLEALGSPHSTLHGGTNSLYKVPYVQGGKCTKEGNHLWLLHNKILRFLLVLVYTACENIL